MEFKAQWQLIYVRSRFDKRTAELLMEMNIECLYLVRNKIRKWKNRTREVVVPLFPGYIFVKVTNIKDCLRILGLSTVASFVKIGKEIAVVPMSVIDSLKLLLKIKQDFDVVSDTIEKGKTYEIVSGPMGGLRCEVVAFNKKEMVLVRVEILGRIILIDISSDTLIS